MQPHQNRCREMKFPNLSSILIVIGVFLLLVVAVNAVLTLTIQTTIHTNSATLTANPTSIDWGTLTPNQQITKSATLTNNGDAPTNPLTMTSTSTVGTVTWDAESLTLPPSQALLVNFSLSVDASAPRGQFNFTIMING